MKMVLIVAMLISCSLACAQQSPKPFGNTIFNYSLTSPNKVKQSLNMDFFKQEGFKQNTDVLGEFLRESNSQRTKPIDNMPILVPNGKFFLEIYGVDENIDHKLRIFDLEKSKYFLRSMG